MYLSKNKHTSFVKQTAKDLGFDYCGISKAAFLEEEAPRLEKWLAEGRHGEMKYMENYFDKRLDPRLVVDGARSVISLLLNYFPQEQQNIRSNTPKISKYAYGADYHYVIKQKCKTFLEILKKEIGDIHGRCFVDSAPVLDKAWAQRSGLGWIGKNSNLINKNNGSFFFIAELIVDIKLEYDSPVKDFCGTCTKCIDACPTQAITEPYVVDGSKCISYFTIELKGNIPEEYKGTFGNWIFGCDICQDVCPWNRFSKPHKEPLFTNKQGFLDWEEREWKDITEEIFNKTFKNSPVKRTGIKGLKRNLKFIEHNNNFPT
jgi:epoxyqueuosine reductase